MQATTLLQKQLLAVNGILHDLCRTITFEEWSARAIASANPPGFIAWHVPRTQDWIVQTVIRGVAEVIEEPRWQGRGALATPGIGAGFTSAEVDRIARATATADVLAYADAVHATLLSWLEETSDEYLDTVPDMVGHQAGRPAYQLPAFRAETDQVIGLPVWRLLAGTGIGHLRDHLGELRTLLQLSRSQAA